MQSNAEFLFEIVDSDWVKLKFLVSILGQPESLQAVWVLGTKIENCIEYEGTSGSQCISSITKGLLSIQNSYNTNPFCVLFNSVSYHVPVTW